MFATVAWRKPERQPGCRLICKPPCAPSLTVGFLPIYRRHGGNPSVSEGAAHLAAALCTLPYGRVSADISAVVAETRASARVPAHLAAALCTIPYGRVSADISPSWRKPERQRGCRLICKPPYAPSITVEFLPTDYHRPSKIKQISLKLFTTLDQELLLRSGQRRPEERSANDWIQVSSQRVAHNQLFRRPTWPSVWINSAGFHSYKNKAVALHTRKATASQNGGADGTRTRDLRRDRPAF